MAQRLWILNIVLAAFLLFFVFKTVKVWSDFDAVSEKTGTAKTAEKRYPAVTKKIVNAPVSEYESVAADNLFSASREEFIPEAEEDDPPVEEVIVKESNRELEAIHVYGIIIMDGYEAAMITNPMRKRGEPKYITVETGETVIGYTVADIQEKRILFEKAGVKYERSLYDQEKPKRKIVKKRDKGVNVVSAGKEISVSQKSSAKSSASSKSGNSKTAGKGAKSQTPSKASEEGEKSEWINTPFGKIKRVIK